MKERGTHADLMMLEGGYHSLLTEHRASRKRRRTRYPLSLEPITENGDLPKASPSESFADEVFKEMGLDPTDVGETGEVYLSLGRAPP